MRVVAKLGLAVAVSLGATNTELECREGSVKITYP
jgi:hypothetical protein